MGKVMKVYTLYYNRKELILKISSEKHWQNEYITSRVTEGDILDYNDCIYLSGTRKLLLEKARKIKQQWIDETKAQLEAIENIKI